MAMIIPNVVDTMDNGVTRNWDIYSKLLNNRIIFLNGEINSDVASLVVAQLLYLESVDPDADICMYINSPGGDVTAGLAIYDTMQFIKCDVSTLCVGYACSMGAFLLAGGARGKRYALPNSEIMIHQVQINGRMQGKASDILISMEHINRSKDKLNQLLALNTDKTIERITKDTEYDYFMNAKEALDYHIIDEIKEKR